MTHPRKQIRQAAKTILINAATAAGSRVYASRHIPVFGSEFPLIAVYTLSESSDKFNESPRELKRELQLTIEAFETDLDGTDDDLDDLAEEIEKAMRKNFYLGLDGVSDQVLTSTEVTIREDGKQEISSIKLTYRIEYYTSEPMEDDVTHDAFEQVNIDWEQPEADVDTDAQDQVDLPQ